MKDWELLRKAIREKRALEAEQDALRQRLQTLIREQSALTRAEEKARDQVEKLEGLSMKRILASLTGSREQALEEARRAAGRAKAALDRSAADCRESEQRIREKEAALLARSTAELDYVQALQQEAWSTELPLSDLEAQLHSLRKEQEQYQTCRETAAELLALVSKVLLISMHGSIRTTRTGVQINDRFKVLEQKLPLCQQRLNDFAALLQEVPDVETERIAAYLGTALTAPLTDLALNDRLADLEYQLPILQKQLKKADAARERRCRTQMAAIGDQLLQLRPEHG